MSHVVEHPVGQRLLVVQSSSGSLTPAAGTPAASKLACHSAVVRRPGPLRPPGGRPVVLHLLLAVGDRTVERLVGEPHRSHEGAPERRASARDGDRGVRVA